MLYLCVITFKVEIAPFRFFKQQFKLTNV